MTTQLYPNPCANGSTTGRAAFATRPISPLPQPPRTRTQSWSICQDFRYCPRSNRSRAQ